MIIIITRPTSLGPSALSETSIWSIISWSQHCAWTTQISTLFSTFFCPQHKHRHACKHTRTDTHTARSSDHERRDVSSLWIRFLFSKGQFDNDPAKMDRKIVLWSDPQMQIGRGSICQRLCVSCTSTDLTAPLGLAVGPGRAKGKDNLREKSRTMELVAFGNGGRVARNACIPYRTRTAWVERCCIEKYLEWWRPLNSSEAKTGEMWLWRRSTCIKGSFSSFKRLNWAFLMQNVRWVDGGKVSVVYRWFLTLVVQ